MLTRTLLIPLLATTILATPAWADALIQRSGQHFDKIGQAIAAAQTGDVIEVTAGTYREALTIAKPLILIGKGQPVIDAGKALVGIRVTGHGVTIDGFKVTTPNAPPHHLDFITTISEEACILAFGTGHSFRNNDLSGCHHGLYLVDVHDFHITGNTMHDNRNDGIFLRNTRNGDVRDNTVADNAVGGISVFKFVVPPHADMIWRRMTKDKFVLTAGVIRDEDAIPQDITIAGNTVTGNGFGGIGIGNARRITIDRNTASRNGGSPMPEDMQITGVGITITNRGYGIGLSCIGHENVVTGNTVADNVNLGIALDMSLNNIIAGNEVTGSDYGIYVAGSWGNRIAGNRVTGNSVNGIRLERGLAVHFPSVANVITGNDLARNAENAWDTSGKDIGAPPNTSFNAANLPVGFPTDFAAANAWDDQGRGNHYDDFDEPSEGFADGNGDGVGETPHAIPGGAAVDHFPLATGPEPTSLATPPSG